MMNKDEYKSAMEKIYANEEFKSKLKYSMELSYTRVNAFKIKRWIPVFAVVILMVCTITAFYSSLWNGNSKTNLTEEFKIIGSTTSENASYISVVYIDGYAYSPSEWLTYSRGSVAGKYEDVKGGKLGEVTLDLKGKRYTGTPPNFSSTWDLGTEVYAIKDIKKERAVLVTNGNYASIFYRERKAVSNDREPINLTVSDIINMLTDTAHISEVELRSEEDGSWMRTSENECLLSLINNEIPKLSLLNSTELSQDLNGNYHRIPINLMFKDGAALHMQVFPEGKYAYVFGGYIRLSPELCMAVRELFNQGEQYPKMSNLFPYKESEVSYLHFVSHKDKVEVLCKNPQWSRAALYSMLNYYRVEEAKEDVFGNLVMTGTLGKTREDSISIDFYETKDKEIIIRLNGCFYKPARGQIVYEQLSDYLFNSTDLGLKQK